MSKSTSKTPRCKPSKPYPEFPLTVNGNGQWSKVIRGRTHYFGPWEDPDGALALYLDQKDDLHAGRSPMQKGDTVRDLCNCYLEDQEEKFQEGKITERTFVDCSRECKFIVKHIGHLAADGIGPQDFTAFYRKFPKTWGLTTRGKMIKQTRAVFRFAANEEYITKLPTFGTKLKPPSQKLKKIQKAQTRTREEETFTPDQIRAILAECDQTNYLQLRAMVLLGINCGFGNADCGRLLESEIKDGWIRIDRRKTGEGRDCPLWLETVDAINDWLAVKKQDCDGLVFVTKYGNSWHKEVRKSPISQAFFRVTKPLEIRGTFYTLRHTFKTVCNQADVNTIVSRRIMGHELRGIDATYSHSIKDEQLVAAVNAVHAWLYVTEEENGGEK